MQYLNLINIGFFSIELTGKEPYVDLYETEEHLIVEIDIPGIDVKNVLIKVIDNSLIIEGTKISNESRKIIKYICLERLREHFRRIIELPVPVNPFEGKATYSEGVLTVHFPKTDSRVIRIKIEKE